MYRLVKGQQALHGLTISEKDQLYNQLACPPPHLPHTCDVQEEAAALEAANVYAMLQSTPLVDAVIGDLRRTQSILDDLDESLKVQDIMS